MNAFTSVLTIKVDLKCPCGCDDLTVLAADCSRRQVLTSPAATIHASSLTLQNTFREDTFAFSWNVGFFDKIRFLSYRNSLVRSALDKLYLWVVPYSKYINLISSLNVLGPGQSIRINSRMPQHSLSYSEWANEDEKQAYLDATSLLSIYKYLYLLILTFIKLF
jgi:hypothetical protein